MRIVLKRTVVGDWHFQIKSSKMHLSVNGVWSIKTVWLTSLQWLVKLAVMAQICFRQVCQPCATVICSSIPTIKLNCLNHVIKLLLSPDELIRCLIIARDAIRVFSLFISNFWSKNAMTRSEKVGAKECRKPKNN